MPKRLERHEKIFTALGKRNGQTFQELTVSADISREPLWLGLKELKTQEVIKRKKKTKRYYLQSKTKNKALRVARDFNIMNFDLEDAMMGLREHETPFELGYTILRSVMYYQSKLNLEQHSPGLTKFEKIECERLIDHCNKVIKKTFEVLEEIDVKQALAIKRALDLATTIPQFELKMAGLANRAQKRRAERIAKKIHLHLLKIQSGL